MRMGERKMKDWTVKTETEKEKVENPLYNGGGEEKREKKKSKKKKKKKNRKSYPHTVEKLYPESWKSDS